MAQHLQIKFSLSRMALGRIATLLCIGFLYQPLQARAADAPVAGPVSLIGQVIMPAGAANGSVSIATVPKGFRLVIQTASFFRSNVASGSIGQVFLQVTLNKVLGYVALPDAVADGAIYPAGTLTATITCGAGSQVIANAYRSGSDTAQETDNILLTGYYVAYTGT